MVNADRNRGFNSNIEYSERVLNFAIVSLQKIIELNYNTKMSYYQAKSILQNHSFTNAIKQTIDIEKKLPPIIPANLRTIIATTFLGFRQMVKINTKIGKWKESEAPKTIRPNLKENSGNKRISIKETKALQRKLISQAVRISKKRVQKEFEVKNFENNLNKIINSFYLKTKITILFKIVKYKTLVSIKSVFRIKRP